MKKLLLFLLSAVMLFAFCMIAFTEPSADSEPAQTESAQAEPVQAEPVQTEPVADPVEYFLPPYVLDVNESVECADFYGYYTAGTEIRAETICTCGCKVTVHFWSDSGRECSTVTYNEKRGGVILPSGGYWHAEVIANYNYACEGSTLLIVEP